MRHWIHRMGSMKLGIVLLLAVLVAMAVGTIVESAKGSDTAMRAVYGAVWFRLLLGVFGVNLFFSLVDRFPWGRQTIGFVLTHSAMLVILVGALVTLTLKVEGHLALWEGEESAAFDASPEGAPAALLPLPFSVRLEAFEIDYYQGTHRPAMFRSRVIVDDRERGVRFPAVIQMNHELSYRGYRLFQSSYNQTRTGEQTILAVSKDPGQPVVFIGYGLLVFGMLTVLGTRIAQRRAATRLVAQGAPGRTPRPLAAAIVTLFALLVLGSLAPARGAEASAAVLDVTTVDALRRLPVQHDGRVMPLDTLAREAVFQITGARRWQGEDPVLAVLRWATDPRNGMDAPVVRVGSKALREHIGLDPHATHASFHALVMNPRVRALIEDARKEQDAGRPLHGLLSDASKLEGRLVWMQDLLEGSSLRVVPGPEPGVEWAPLEGPPTPGAMLAIQRAPKTAAFVPGAQVLDREVLYNKLRPSRLAWWILLLSACVSLVGFWRRNAYLDAIALAGLVAGFGVMTWGIGMRWVIADRIPASNMYESMLFLGWGVGLFALAAFVVLRNRLVILNATAMAALAMMLADLLPIDPFIHPVPPVLAGTPWLAIHVPIIMVSYSVLALGVLIAHMQVGLEIFAPGKLRLAARLNDLLYWYLHVGAILLIVGIMTGSIWAASSWGRYWGWDPKEVWSLIAFLAYMAILHGRMDKLLGPLGVAALSIVAFLTILMTYIGVNFVLSSGLHSYGFGSSRVVTWLVLVAVAEGAFIAGGFLARVWRRPPAGARGALAPAS